MRYFDTLSTLSGSCASIAKGVLNLLSENLGVPANLPERRHFHRQKDLTSCGRWILHYVEEEARVNLGERRGTFTPDLLYRGKRVNKFQEALNKRVSQGAVSESSQPWLPAQQTLKKEAEKTTTPAEVVAEGGTLKL